MDLLSPTLTWFPPWPSKSRKTWKGEISNSATITDPWEFTWEITEKIFQNNSLMTLWSISMNWWKLFQTRRRKKFRNYKGSYWRHFLWRKFKTRCSPLWNSTCLNNKMKLCCFILFVFDILNVFQSDNQIKILTPLPRLQKLFSGQMRSHVKVFEFFSF